MVSLNGRQNGRAAAKGLFQGGLQIVEEHQRLMHIHHVNDPLLPLFQQLRTHKALALQSKSSLLGDSPPFCGKNGKAAVFLQGLGNDLRQQKLGRIPDGLAVMDLPLPGVDPGDVKHLPAGPPPYGVGQLHAL